MILVTGATGFVGHALARRLHAARIPFRILARNARKAAALQKETGCEVALGGFGDARALREACHGTHAVIHLVGIIGETRGNTFASAHVEATRAITAAAREAGVSRYLHMSALNTRETAPSRYHRSKWEAEEIVRASGLSWTLFRPALIYGKGDLMTRLLVLLMRPPLSCLQGGVFPVLGDGTTPVQPIHVDDVAAAFVSALANPRAFGRTYELAGPTLSFREMVETLARAQGLNPGFIQVSPPAIPITAALEYLRGRRPVIAAIPPALAKTVLFFSDLINPFPIPRYDQALMLEEAQAGDPEPARRDLQIHARPYSPVVD